MLSITFIRYLYIILHILILILSTIVFNDAIKQLLNLITTYFYMNINSKFSIINLK